MKVIARINIDTIMALTCENLIFDYCLHFPVRGFISIKDITPV